MYSLEEIRIAMRIFHYLLEHSELNHQSDSELYKQFSEQKIKEILEGFEEEANVSIRKFDDTIYIIPNVDNEFLGYKRHELKKEIFSRSDMKNFDLFLAMYIMIHLTSEFYGGKGSNVIIRDMMQIGDLDASITSRLQQFRNEDRVNVNDETKLVITDIANYYFEKLNEDDNLAHKTRRWYIYSVMNFLKKEGLISILDESTIIPTRKFNRLASNYFLNYERLEDINRILDKYKGGEVDAETK